MKISWYLVLVAILPLVILGGSASPTDNGNNAWAQTPCNNNNNNKRGIVVGSNDTVVPLVGNWATTSSCNPTPTQTSPTTTSTGTKATWEAPSPTPEPIKCTPANTNLWSWSDYLYHTYGYGVTPALGVIGGMLMLIGLHLMSFGFRIFRGTLGLVGFTVFGIVTWIGLTNGEPAGGYPHQDIIYVTVIIGLGLLGALLLMFFWFVGIYLIGSLLGFLFSLFILSWKQDLVIENNIARICFIIGIIFLFSGAIYMAERYVILFSLSFSGAYMFVLGLDLFVHTGFINGPRSILDHNPCHNITYRITTGIYVMLAMVIVLTILAFGWQYYWNIILMHRYFGVNVVPVKAETVTAAKSSHTPTAAGTVVAAVSEKVPTSHHSEVVVLSEKAPTSHHSEIIAVPTHKSHSHHSAPLSVIRENASAIISGGPSHHTSHHTSPVVTSRARSVVESVAPSSHHTVISPSRRSGTIVSPSHHSGGLLSGVVAGLLSGGGSNGGPLAASSRHSVAPTATRSARGTVLPVPSVAGSHHTGSAAPLESVHSASKSGNGSHHTSHHTSHHSLAPSMIAASRSAAASAAASGTKFNISASAYLTHGQRSGGSAQPEDDAISTSTTIRSEQPKPPSSKKMFGFIPIVY